MSTIAINALKQEEKRLAEALRETTKDYAETIADGKHAQAIVDAQQRQLNDVVAAIETLERQYADRQQQHETGADA